MKGPAHILRRLLARHVERRRRARFARSVQHLHGPTQAQAAPDETVLIAVVRDGSYYLDAFFAHYRAMGIRHFVFFDNGSGDDTVARIKAEPDTIIDQSPLPLAPYEDLIRAYPANTYGADRWCLFVDIDEMFDFEGCQTYGIRALTSYLTAQGHTALVAQMLEMFPKTTLAMAAHLPYDRVLEAFLYFDISAVQRFEYHGDQIEFSALLGRNIVTNPDIRLCFGGVRGKVLGEDCCLTKHPLVFNAAHVTPAPHPHLSMGVTCSDVTGVIKHYRFANAAPKRDAAMRATGGVAQGAGHARATRMPHDSDLSLFSLDARRWNRIALLERAGFLHGSDAYRAHLKALGSNASRPL